jgi:hypothetical protein
VAKITSAKKHWVVLRCKAKREIYILPNPGNIGI